MIRKRIRLPIRAVSLVSAALLSLEAHAAVLFEFDYSNGTHFLDPVEGLARRTALEEAAASLGSVFAHTATIQLSVTTTNDAQSSTLASAASEPMEVAENFFGFTPDVVQNKILTGVDANGDAADGSVDVNFGQAWDLDDQISPDQFDFKATMIHELLHAVGFSSSIFSDGTDVYFTPPGESGVWSTFDQFISGPDGVSIIDENYALNPDSWISHSTGGASPANGLFFNGPKATAANGGMSVGIYSPSEWEEGSSGSHLDDENAALNGMLMLSTTDTGQYTRELSAIEKAMLEDLGFEIASPTSTSAPTLTIQPSSSGLILTVSGNNGRYTIARSNDLNSWNALTTVTIDQETGSATYSIPMNEVTGDAYFTAFGS